MTVQPKDLVFGSFDCKVSFFSLFNKIMIVSGMSVRDLKHTLTFVLSKVDYYRLFSDDAS